MKLRYRIKEILGSLILLILIYSISGFSQVMEFSEEEAEKETKEEETMEFTEEEAEKPAEETKEEEGFLEGIVSEEEKEEEVEEVAEVKKLPPLPIYAVQRIYALKKNRFELIPRFGFSLNDPYVQHYAFNVGVNWYITEVLSIGGEFVWYYFNDETDTNFHMQRSFRLIEPINEYRFGAYVNFSYIPTYGKFALWNYWILYWDIFVTGGVGVTETRPIAAIDPEYRDFSSSKATTSTHFNYSVTIPIGIGGRLFISRWLAVFAEIRGYLTPQKIENIKVAEYTCKTLEACNQEAQTANDGVSGEERWKNSRANPDTWYGGTDWTFNIMFNVGLSIYLPPTFKYRLPK